MKRIFPHIKKITHWIVRSCLCVIVAFYTLSLLKRTCMQLIHKKTGYVVAEETKESFEIKDPFLLKDLQIHGILIPPPLREDFDGKSTIRMDDPLFSRAFREIYLKMHSSQNTYESRDATPQS